MFCSLQVPCPRSAQARRLKISTVTPPRAAQASPITLLPPLLLNSLYPGPQKAQSCVSHYCAVSCLLAFALVRPCLDIQLGASLNAACFWPGEKFACLRKLSELVTPCLGLLLSRVWGLKWLAMECLVPPHPPQGLIPGKALFVIEPSNVHMTEDPLCVGIRHQGLPRLLSHFPLPVTPFLQSEIEVPS